MFVNDIAGEQELEATLLSQRFHHRRIPYYLKVYFKKFKGVKRLFKKKKKIFGNLRYCLNLFFVVVVNNYKHPKTTIILKPKKN